MRLRLSSSQNAMLNLAGDGWWRWDYRARNRVLTDHQRVALMVTGRDRLKEITGQDFGSDLAAWRGYLLSVGNNFEYTDMTTRGFELVDGVVLPAIGDRERERLIKWRERYGAVYLGKLRSAPIFRYGDVFCYAIPDVGGVYHIFRPDYQRTLFVGQSINMRSHVLGKQVKAMVLRKVKAWQMEEGRAVLPGDLFHVQAIPVRERDRLMFADYAAEHLKPVISYRAE